jgi:hypothetical protein
MSKYIFFGIAMQAMVTGLLTALNLITPNAVQQLIVSAYFAIIAGIVYILEKRR